MFDYIIKYALLFLCFGATHAAEQPPGICYLAQLPVEVLDNIARYLEWHDRETDEAFIERTKKYGTLSPEDEQKLERHRSWESGEKQAKTLTSYSVDRSKIMMLERCPGYVYYAGSAPCKTLEYKMTTVDLKNDMAQRNIYRAIVRHNDLANMSKRVTHLIAISRDDTQCAQLQERRNNGVAGFYDKGPGTVLVVTKLHKTCTVREFPLPNTFIASNYLSIGFNKQGTKLIAHHTVLGLASYRIIPLVPPEEDAAKNAMTFDAYLQTYLICKSLI